MQVDKSICMSCDKLVTCLVTGNISYLHHVCTGDLDLKSEQSYVWCDGQKALTTNVQMNGRKSKKTDK